LIRPFEWRRHHRAFATKFLAVTAIHGRIVVDAASSLGGGKYPALSEPARPTRMKKMWGQFGDMPMPSPAA